MVSENCILKKLNLSGNCLSDKNVEMLTIALEVGLNSILTLRDTNSYRNSIF